jgi:hypothetical protein
VLTFNNRTLIVTPSVSDLSFFFRSPLLSLHLCKVVSAMRTFANCSVQESTVFGAPLEDEVAIVFLPDCSGLFLPHLSQGQSLARGQHWEAKTLAEELLGPSISLVLAATYRLSVVSLAVLQDSGWYQVGFSQAQDMHWGKNLGCNFFLGDQSCSGPMFCNTAGSAGCSYNGLYRARCAASRFSDGCMIMQPVANVGELLFVVFADPG